MQILAFLLALLVDALAIAAAIAVLRRSSSSILRAGAIAFAVVTVLGTTAAASLTTVTVQTRLVMEGMKRQEPTATILATDREMRGKLETAVREGLSRDGSKVENVRAAVTDVLKPYMTYRLGHAPDRFTIASAKATLTMLNRARSQGPATCSAVLSGDLETLRRLAAPETSSWLPDLLNAEPLDQVRVADQQTFGAFIQEVARQKGWTMQDLGSFGNRQGRMACDYPIATIGAAVALPEDQAAAMLRRLGYGGQVVTTR